MTSNYPYDNVADMRLKSLGRKLLRVTMTLTGKQGETAHKEAQATAVAIMTQALGFNPSGSGPNRVTDDQVRAAIPRTEGMLRLAGAYERASSRAGRGHRKL